MQSAFGGLYHLSPACPVCVQRTGRRQAGTSATINEALPHQSVHSDKMKSRFSLCSSLLIVKIHIFEVFFKRFEVIVSFVVGQLFVIVFIDPPVSAMLVA